VLAAHCSIYTSLKKHKKNLQQEQERNDGLLPCCWLSTPAVSSAYSSFDIFLAACTHALAVLRARPENSENTNSQIFSPPPKKENKKERKNGKSGEREREKGGGGGERECLFWQRVIFFSFFFFRYFPFSIFSPQPRLAADGLRKRRKRGAMRTSVAVKRRHQASFTFAWSFPYYYAYTCVCPCENQG
jgi:hypothetical protein